MRYFPAPPIRERCHALNNKASVDNPVIILINRVYPSEGGDGKGGVDDYVYLFGKLVNPPDEVVASVARIIRADLVKDKVENIGSGFLYFFIRPDFTILSRVSPSGK